MNYPAIRPDNANYPAGYRIVEKSAIRPDSLSGASLTVIRDTLVSLLVSVTLVTWPYGDRSFSRGRPVTVRWRAAPDWISWWTGYS